MRIQLGVVVLSAWLGAPALAFEALGEVQTESSSAAYDQDSVIGPRVSMYRQKDGRWVGRIHGRIVEAFETKDGDLRGVNFALYFERKDDAIILRGNWEYDTLYTKIPDDPVQQTILRLTFKGDAKERLPMRPQYLLAVLGAF